MQKYDERSFPESGYRADPGKLLKYPKKLQKCDNYLHPSKLKSGIVAIRKKLEVIICRKR